MLLFRSTRGFQSLRDELGKPDKDERPPPDEQDVRHICRGEGLAQRKHEQHPQDGREGRYEVEDECLPERIGNGGKGREY